MVAVINDPVPSRMTDNKIGTKMCPKFEKKINLLFGSDWCKVQKEAILVELRRRDSPDLQHFFAQTK